MRKLLTAIIMISITTIMIAKEIDLTKSKGTNQKVISILSPAPEEDTVKRMANIKITFDKKLKQKSIKKSIKLKYLGCKQERKAVIKQRRDKNIQKCKQRYKKNKHLKRECIQCAREVFRYQKKRNCKKRDIKGKVKYLKKRDVLLFNPHKKLRPGYYQVTVKGLRTQDGTKIKKISYRFEVSKNNIESITLSQNDINLKEKESTKLTLQAIYKDGTTEDITKDINWIIGDATLVSIDADGNLKALKAGETLVQAEYHGKVSQEIKATITAKEEVINGYVLPPEPDETLNNSTLLGIDSNDNGVRDDVERLIIIEEAKNPNFPKTHTALTLQYAWAWQKMLENPTIESDEYLAQASACKRYFFDKHTINLNFRDYMKWKKEHSSMHIGLQDKLFNTKERIKQRFAFNKACSGNIFKAKKAVISACQTNIDMLGE